MKIHKLIKELEELEAELGEDIEVEIVLDRLLDTSKFKLDEVSSINGKKVALIHRAV